MIHADRLIGEAPVFLEVLERVSEVARLDKPVLIVGERGTGKELIASRLHYLSSRWESVYLQMNCAALSESLLESELFGHEAGSFTGASKRHLGRFERAHNGTLFLDELSTTSIRVQEKILRLIEYGQFERLGGSSTLTVDVRIVAATNQDLQAQAARGEFREDLLDRLAFDVITLPPLRERNDDIMLLAEFFAVNMASELGYEYFAGFEKTAVDVLQNYAWPGNVRELKNVIERAVYRSNENPIDSIVIDPFESPYRPTQSRDRAEQTSNHPKLPVDLGEEVAKFEVSLLQSALELAKHNQRVAAKNLGLSYHQLRHRLLKYKLLDEPT